MPRARMDKRDLELYYELWLAGKNLNQILNKLKKDGFTLRMTRKKLLDWTPTFLTYCRERVKKETRDRLAQGKKADLLKLTEDRERQFLDYVSAGLSFADAAEMMNIPLITVMDFWFKDNPIFHAQARSAARFQNVKVTQALYKRAVGFTYKERSTTSGVNTGKLGPMEIDTTTEVMKTVPGAISAQKFWLINREPDLWTLDGTNPAKNNKGKILEAIDMMAEIDEVDLEAMDNE